MLHFQRSSKKTFMQRLRATAIYWGLPVMCLELIGIPRQAWGLILLIELPATVVGVFIFTLIEYGIVRHIQRHWMKEQPFAK
jgi:hypothetical protein